MTDFRALLEILSRAQVEFIVIGGAAATAHGSARLTVDLDIVYRRSSENIGRLVAGLAPCRGHDPTGPELHPDDHRRRLGSIRRDYRRRRL